MRLIAKVLSVSFLTACLSGTAVPVVEVTGTWGGNDAGLIAADTSAHVHIGCTLGDTATPIRPGADGRFEANGTYNVDAYPIDRGILHPAVFSGRINGKVLVLTVTLTDIGRVLGPVSLVRGVQPTMGTCPICRVRTPD